MKTAQIILLIGAGVLSFGASFGVSWLTRTKQPAVAKAVELAAEESAQTEDQNSLDNLYSSQPERRSKFYMEEKQLKTLIYDIRERIEDYEYREKQLNQESDRIIMARKTLQEDVEQLNRLRDKLKDMLAEVKQKEEQLAKSVVEIEAVEKKNLERIAATYDKMDSVQASRIMLTMAGNSQLNDAVKILYYMSERNAANLLGEISVKQPEVSSMLSLHLKKIKEGN